MSKLMQFARQNLAKLVVAGSTLVGGAGYYAYDVTHIVSAKEAMTKPEGSSVRMEFPVASGIDIGRGVLLNDVKYTGPNTQDMRTVFVPKSAKGYELVSDPKSARGKTIIIKGTRSSYQGKPQVEAAEVSTK